MPQHPARTRRRGFAGAGVHAGGRHQKGEFFTKYKYDTERGLIINTLSDEIGEMAIEIEKERECHGFTAQYRALSKTYNDTTKHYLNLVKELEAENADAGDALAAFNVGA